MTKSERKKEKEARDEFRTRAMACHRDLQVVLERYAISLDNDGYEAGYLVYVDDRSPTSNAETEETIQKLIRKADRDARKAAE